MHLLEIHEPSAPVAQVKNTELGIGIDFGTTNSLVAFVSNNKPYIIDDILVPSTISSNLVIGAEGIRSIKRLIGKSFTDIQNSSDISADIKNAIKEENGIIKIKIGSRYFSIAEAVSLILSYLKEKAEKHLEQKIVKTVITVPAHFDDTMRNVVKYAANLAGLDVLRLISEPTAAAYAYGLENKAEGMYLVYDLGGGTFDVSLLNMRMGVFQVLATGGDVNLGGDDIDNILASHIKDNSKAKHIKEHLSYHESYEDILDLASFEKLIDPIISKTIDITETVAGSYLPKIKAIVLVGGASRIPLITKKLSKFGIPIHNDMDPDKVVALGAALQAKNLTSGSQDLIIDVVPLSLGIGLMGGIVEKVILRNMPIPTSVTKEFTTYADNQTAMKLDIVQGEREMVDDCRLLANFELINIPPMKAGAARIEVTFKIDADALLSVSAIEKVTGKTQEIEVRPGYGIGQNDIRSMLEDAYKNAASDHIRKLFAETLAEAKQELHNVRAAIKETPELLENQEKEQIEKLLKTIEDLTNKATLLKCEEELTEMRNNIVQQLSQLQNFTKEFIERRMDYVVQHILKSTNISKAP